MNKQKIKANKKKLVQKYKNQLLLYYGNHNKNKKINQQHIQNNKKPVVEKSTTGCNSITYANLSIKHG